MITLKDIIDLRPYCKVCIHNNKDYDFIDLCRHPENYAITDMNVFENRLDILIKHEDAILEPNHLFTKDNIVGTVFINEKGEVCVRS